jgi:hypothetical protein
LSTTVKANLLDAHSFGFKTYYVGLFRWVHLCLALYLCSTALNAIHFDYPYAYGFLFFVLISLPLSFLTKIVILRRLDSELEVIIESRLLGIKLRGRKYALGSSHSAEIVKQGKLYQLVCDKDTNITVHLGRIRNAELERFKTWFH